ncbi:YbaN family protein [Microbulbifer sp. TYP-18]|uniref:YbaN family protein n=1 Tax=Microbulbifer sp. TYP-18 TaxID=3230024 RepID=UPI0034C5FDDB
MRRFLALILAYLFLALALVGILVPGLPTVPFLLLTAWFAAKGSERLHRWLYAHPHLGKLLIDWEQQGAISRGAKLLAIIMLVVSWTILYHRLESTWVLAGIALLFVTVAGYLVSRPEPDSDK